MKDEVRFGEECLQSGFCRRFIEYVFVGLPGKRRDHGAPAILCNVRLKTLRRA
jgi:hypothetical protein